MQTAPPTLDQQAAELADEIARMPFAYIVVIVEGGEDLPGYDIAREREKLAELQRQIKTLDPAMIREVGYLLAEDARSNELCGNQRKANVEWEYLDRLARFQRACEAAR
jgi:hypothetical protein